MAPMANGDRAMEARASHPTAHVWLRRHGARGQGQEIHVTPWPAPAMPVGAWSERCSAWGGRRHCCRKWLTCGTQLAAAAGGADGRMGMSGVLGRLAWPRARAVVEGGRGWAGWAAKLSRPGLLRGFLLSFLFLFFFSSPLFEFEFGFGI